MPREDAPGVLGREPETMLEACALQEVLRYRRALIAIEKTRPEMPHLDTDHPENIWKIATDALDEGDEVVLDPASDALLATRVTWQDDMKRLREIAAERERLLRRPFTAASSMDEEARWFGEVAEHLARTTTEGGPPLPDDWKEVMGV